LIHRIVIATLCLALVFSEASGACTSLLPTLFNQTISPFECSQVLAKLPFRETWSVSGTKGLIDSQGLGTGFTMYLPATHTEFEFDPSRLFIDISLGVLRINASIGHVFADRNNHQTALGLGAPLPSITPIEVAMTIRQPPRGAGKLEQANLWFGTNENNFFKFAWLSRTTGNTVQLVREHPKGNYIWESGKIAHAETVTLSYLLTSYPPCVEARYRINSTLNWTILANYTNATVLSPFFNLDPIDRGELNTSSFLGIFCTSYDLNYTVFEFEEFWIEPEGYTPPSPSEETPSSNLSPSSNPPSPTPSSTPTPEVPWDNSTVISTEGEMTSRDAIGGGFGNPRFNPPSDGTTSNAANSPTRCCFLWVITRGGFVILHGIFSIRFN